MSLPPEREEGFREPEVGEPAPQPPVIRLQMPFKRPWLSYGILGVTVGFYLLQMASQQCVYFGSGVSYVLDCTAIHLAKINEAIRQGELWRLITPVLLHGSSMHILFNMYALYVLGPGLERYYGALRFGLLYLVSGVAGNVASFLLSAQPSLGASTAIFGLVAAQAMFILRNRILFGRQSAAILTNIAFVIGVNLLLGLSPRIDNWGHIGGLLGGLAFAGLAGAVFKVTGLMPDLRLEDQRHDSRALFVAASLVLGLVLAVVVTI